MQDLSDNPSRLLSGAATMFEREHYQLAWLLTTMELIRNRNDYFALCLHAKCLHFLGKHNDHKATSLYKRAMESNPEHPLAHAGLGLIHYTNASRIVREYSMFPGGASIMFADESVPSRHSLSLGFADNECGNRRVAIASLEKAAQLTEEGDERIELLKMAADMHCLISSTAGMKAYKKLLELAPNHVNTHFELAGTYAAAGEREAALHEYRFIEASAPELAPDLAEVLAQWGIEIDES